MFVPSADSVHAPHRASSDPHLLAHGMLAVPLEVAECAASGRFALIDGQSGRGLAAGAERALGELVVE